MFTLIDYAHARYIWRWMGVELYTSAWSPKRWEFALVGFLGDARKQGSISNPQSA